MEGNRKQFSASRQILMRDTENKETFSVIFSVKIFIFCVKSWEGNIGNKKIAQCSVAAVFFDKDAAAFLYRDLFIIHFQKIFK